MTNLDLSVLRAVARLSRTRRAVDVESIALRAGGSLEEVRGSLARLEGARLVDRSPRVRLTMTGLALAAASAPRGAVVGERRRTGRPAAQKPAASRRAA